MHVFSFGDAILPLMGGALIGLSATILHALTGKIAGVSGILGGVVAPGHAGDRGWRLAFLAGLLTGGAALMLLRPQVFGLVVGTVGRPLLPFLVSGLMVGIGTRMSGGCTSGHGVCGLSRLSIRSLVATVTFMATGALTVLVVRHVVNS